MAMDKGQTLSELGQDEPLCGAVTSAHRYENYP